MMTLRVLDDASRSVRAFDLGRFDLEDPGVRAVLLAAVVDTIDAEPEAEAVELSVDGEVVDFMSLAYYGPLDRRENVHRFAVDLFQALDDMAPPPKSGVRDAYLRNRRA